MIELSQIQNTSKLKELRGQINTMVDEINGNQMVVGQVLRPKANILRNTTTVGTVDMWYTNRLFAICMPGPDGVYVAQVFGVLLSYAQVSSNDITGIKIDIPAVKLPNRTTEEKLFVNSLSQGFIPDDDFYDVYNTGLQFGLYTMGSNDSIALVTDTALDNKPTTIVLNSQRLQVDSADHSLHLYLSHTDYSPQS